MREKCSDRFVDFTENKVKYDGFAENTFKFIEAFQSVDETLWNRFVNQFRIHSDTDEGWRGEYWGKMMRGASLVYAYTKNEKLYSILKNTVEDMMDCAGKNGRISSYPEESEFKGWDIWCRKYVILGMQYFMEICRDEEFKNKIIASMCAQVDYMMEKIGSGEGKTEITAAATPVWRGVNASSFLEPTVRLYKLTGEKKYLDFAEYIVSCGGADIENLFELAYEGGLYPYQYPVVKAYEIISCFEGLLEYYKVTGTEKYKTAVLNFADKLLESDFTVVGGCGCTHELFDHSTVRQANTNNRKIMQETCVTVTLMKFLYRVHKLTGDPKYADAFEIAFYNAYLGAINTEKVIDPMILNEYGDLAAEPLPFDSYSPLTAGTRGNAIGGFKIMPDNHYYGCCACIGSVGIGILPQIQILKMQDGIALNMYINGTVSTFMPSGKRVVLDVKTEYPKCAKVLIAVNPEESEKFVLNIRNPYWSRNTVAVVNGESVKTESGYICIDRVWEKGDTVELSLDMTAEAIYPEAYGSQVIMTKIVGETGYTLPVFDRQDPIAGRHIAVRRGPVMLAQENRLGYSVDDPIDVKVNPDKSVDVRLAEKEIPYDAIVKAELPLTNGKTITVTDYASSGKLWTEESKMAVWMLTE